MQFIGMLKHFSPLLFGPKDTTILLLRHAEKVVVNDLSLDMSQPLTENGVNKARELGRFLKTVCKEVARPKSSHVGRCVQTAKMLMSSFASVSEVEIEVDSSKILSYEGAYTTNNHEQVENFRKYSIDDMFTRLFSGEILPGMRHAAEGTAILLYELLHDFETLHAPTCYITHDFMLALFVGTLTGTKVVTENWFNYLEGVAFKKTPDNRLMLYWGTSCFDVTEKSNSLMQTFSLTSSSYITRRVANNPNEEADHPTTLASTHPST